MRVGGLLVVGALCLAACGTGDAPTPGLEGSPDLTPIGSGEPPAATEVAPTTTATTLANEPSESTQPSPSSTPDSTTTSTTTTPATTVDPASLVVDACRTLTTAGYETRKATRAALSDDGLDAVRNECSDALDRLDDAVVIEDRMAAFNAGADPLGATDLSCEGGSFSLTVTNNVDHPIGVHASLRLTAEGIDGPLGSTLEPLVIWSLQPGASAPLAGDFRVNRPTEAPLTCEVDITAFDATASDADASTGTTRVPELAVDDPSQWLPFLVAQGAAIIGSGQPDLAAVIEDVRSAEYASVRALTDVEIDEPAPSGTISVCTASIVRPDDRQISLVYFDESADGSQLQHGLFRRGNDDQWRWLSTSLYFDSQNYWDCGTPSINR